MEMPGFWTALAVIQVFGLLFLIGGIVELRKRMPSRSSGIGIVLLGFGLIPFYTLGLPRTITMAELIEKLAFDMLVILPVILILGLAMWLHSKHVGRS